MALSKRSTDIRKAFESAGSDLHRATEASFECSLLIAKAKKSHNIGEQPIKPACLKMVERLCNRPTLTTLSRTEFLTWLDITSCTRSLGMLPLPFSWMKRQ